MFRYLTPFQHFRNDKAMVGIQLERVQTFKTHQNLGKVKEYQPSGIIRLQEFDFCKQPLIPLFNRVYSYFFDSLNDLVEGYIYITKGNPNVALKDLGTRQSNIFYILDEPQRGDEHERERRAMPSYIKEVLPYIDTGELSYKRLIYFRWYKNGLGLLTKSGDASYIIKIVKSVHCLSFISCI